MNALRYLASSLLYIWDKSGQTAQLAAVVTIVASLMALLAAFVNRRSSRLVARDAKQREILLAVLQPVIKDADDVFVHFVKVGRLMNEAALARERVRDPDSGWPPPVDAEQRVIMALGWFNRRRPMFDSVLILHRFPILRQTGDAIDDLVFAAGEKATSHFENVAGWLVVIEPEILRIFANYHRAIDHVLFHTNNTWAAWLAAKRYRTAFVRFITRRPREYRYRGFRWY